MVGSLVEDGLVEACHDISGGGLLVTLAEMIMGAEDPLPGASVDVGEPGRGLSAADKLFCEAGGFVLEVDREGEKALRTRAAEQGAPLFRIGEVTGDGALRVDLDGRPLAEWRAEKLRSVWKGALQSIFTGV